MPLMLVSKVRSCKMQQYCYKTRLVFVPLPQLCWGRKILPAVGAEAAQEQDVGQKESGYLLPFHHSVTTVESEKTFCQNISLEPGDSTRIIDNPHTIGVRTRFPFPLPLLNPINDEA